LRLSTLRHSNVFAFGWSLMKDFTEWSITGQVGPIKGATSRLID
jgi:hypothetical protein